MASREHDGRLRRIERGSGMLARQRQAFILERVREDGAVRVADLVRELGVSDMTVRRDLEILDDAGLLEKVHGGATSLTGHALFEPGFAAKSSLQQAEKDAIADAAAALVEPGMAVGVSAGTTTYALARRLADIPGLTVVTNSIRVADVLYQVGRTDQTIDPDRRRPHAVGGARRARSRSPPCAPSTWTSCSSASTAWTRTPGSPARTSSRRTPTARSSRPAAAWSSSPTTRSGASSASARSPDSTRRTSSSRTPGSTADARAARSRPRSASSSSSIRWPAGGARRSCHLSAPPAASETARWRVRPRHPATCGRHAADRARARPASALRPAHRRVGPRVRRPDARPWLGAEEPEVTHERPTYVAGLLPVPGQRARQRRPQPGLRLDLRVRQRLRRAARPTPPIDDRRGRPAARRGGARRRAGSCASRPATT